jgi:hypothetical protein
MADFGETRTRVARLEDRAGEAIEAIDRKVAAERRAERPAGSVAPAAGRARRTAGA